MKMITKRFLQMVYGLFAVGICFSACAMMDDYKIGDIHAYETYERSNLVRYYNQKLEHGKYLVLKEVIYGSDEGKKSVALILIVPNFPHILLRRYNRDDVSAIAAEITRKFVLQKKEIFVFEE